MNVIITFGGSRVPYFYNLVNYNNFNATISNGENIHHLQNTPYGWKIIGVRQPHSIKFYEMATLDDCDKMYSQYKVKCDKYWNLWVAPNQSSGYYEDIIQRLTECTNSRYSHHYQCEEGIDESHSHAIKKIEEKIITARLWDSLNYSEEYPQWLPFQSLHSLIEEALTYNKDLLYEKWVELFGFPNVRLNKSNIATLVTYLRNS